MAEYLIEIPERLRWPRVGHVHGPTLLILIMYDARERKNIKPVCFPLPTASKYHGHNVNPLAERDVDRPRPTDRLHLIRYNVEFHSNTFDRLYSKGLMIG